MIDRRVELPAMRSDGSLISVELTVTRIEATEPPIFTGFVRDLSDRAEAERVRQHLAEVVRGTQDAVITKDLEGIVTSWNPAAERLYGYSAEEAIGRHISFLVPPDHKHEEMRILERVDRRRAPRDVRDRAHPGRRRADRGLAHRLADLPARCAAWSAPRSSPATSRPRPAAAAPRSSWSPPAACSTPRWTPAETARTIVAHGGAGARRLLRDRLPPRRRLPRRQRRRRRRPGGRGEAGGAAQGASRSTRTGRTRSPRCCARGGR